MSIPLEQRRIPLVGHTQYNHLVVVLDTCLDAGVDINANPENPINTLLYEVGCLIQKYEDVSVAPLLG